MSDKVFLDSNVMLYGLDNSSKKKKRKVYQIMRDNESFITPQIIFECLNVATRKFKHSKEDALAFISRLTKFTQIVDENSLTVEKALQLYSKHSFQVYDSKIIASALDLLMRIVKQVTGVYQSVAYFSKD